MDAKPLQTPPKVHAVIVHHRGKAMLGRCLESLLASRGVELEVVVVSNDCREELPDVAGVSPRIHSVAAPRALGFSEANNLGVAWAAGRLGEPEYYYFVNNDTVSEPDALRELVAALRDDPEAAVAGPQLRILGAPEHLNSLGLNLTEDGWGWDEGIGVALDDYGPLPEKREVIAVTGSALLADAAAYREVGGWTEIYDYYFEDLDLCLKVWDRGRRVLHVPRSLVYHRISATMTEGSQRKEHFFWRNRLLLATIHWPFRLLWKVYYRAVVLEILSSPWRHNQLQRRALRGALERLPRLLRLRRRHRGGRPWRRFLRPPGSVPVITLPEVRDEPGVSPGGPAVGAGSESDGGLPADVLERVRKSVPARPEGRRVLVVGWAPLPFENQLMNYAPGVRSWQLAAPLQADGHAVCLVCGRIPGACRADMPEVEVFERDGVLCVTLADALHEDGGALSAVAGAFRPEVVVGASALPSRRALRVAGELPLWVDFFGDPLAEAQAKAAAEGGRGAGRDHVLAYWRLAMDLLERGDAFGAVSERQKYALLGQLGLAGRLGRETAGVELVHTVPCCLPPRRDRPGRDGPGRDGPASGEGRPPSPPADLDDGDFVVLWSGGYNTWGDADTLFAALERAMAARPEIRFVSTGGEIEGHDESSYGRFRRLVEASGHRDRFLLKGRLPELEAAGYFRRADLGVVTERVLAERVLGSSGRVLRWLADGLPFVCTRLSELGETVAAEGLGLTYPPGDAEALAERIVQAAADPGKLREMAGRARSWAEAHLGAETTTRPLRAWVADARPAPDRGRSGASSEPFHFLRGELERAAAELAEERRASEELRAGYHAVRAELGDVHQSKMWKLWMFYLRTRRAFLWPFRR